MTWGALELIARLRKTEPDSLKEDTQETIALIGGGFAVMLMILSLVVVPRRNRPGYVGCSDSPGDPPWIGDVSHQRYCQSADMDRSKTPKICESPTWAARDVHRPPAPTVPQPVKADAYHDLLAKAQYDKARAERLIEDERKHMPSASFDELCKSATARSDRSTTRADRA